WFLHDKIKCYDWARRHNFPCPQIFARFDAPENIILDPDREQFVLKPTRFSSTRGVMVLHRQDGVYFDALSKRAVDGKSILAEQVELNNTYPVRSNQWITEEVVIDAAGHPVPIDLKAYAFRGDIALWLVIDRNAKPTRVDWFDGKFEPLAPGRMRLNPKYVQAGDGIPPKNASELVELAT